MHESKRYRKLQKQTRNEKQDWKLFENVMLKPVYVRQSNNEKQDLKLFDYAYSLNSGISHTRLIKQKAEFNV